MATQRRIGSEDSESRERLLDAAEQLLHREGHSAVTVRRIAAEAGLKRQLVHYYFRSMEDLFLEVLERAYERHFARLAGALDSPNPVRGLWQSAFLAEAILLEIYTLPLANQFDSIRRSIADFLARSRELQVATLRRFLAARAPAPLDPGPEALAVFIRGIAREIAAERHLGFENGHAEAIAAIERVLALYDPAPAAAG
jgi:AcrR family transcriptional regulator